jgi:hypothetical protein
MTRDRLPEMETPALQQEYERYHGRALADRRKIRIFVMVGCCACFGGTIIGLLCVPFVPHVAHKIVLVSVGSVCAAVVFPWRYVEPWSLRVEEEVWHRLGQVPEGKCNASRRLYGLKGGAWMFAAIECEEAHLPGDCPLCGAR